VPSRRYPECNRRVLEQLWSRAVRSTASRDHHRAKLLRRSDGLRSSGGASEQRDRRSGQTSLFGLLAPEPVKVADAPKLGETYPEIEEWSPQAAPRVREGGARLLRLRHPLDRYRVICSATRARRRVTSSPGAAASAPTRSRHRQPVPREDHEKGDKMAAASVLEDAEGTLEVIAFHQDLREGPPRARQRRADPVSGDVKNEGNSEAPSGRCSRDRRAAVRAAPGEDLACHIHLNADTLTLDEIDSSDDPRQRDPR